MLTAKKNVIFLLSLPRSGSTLLQRILSRHHDIKTESETWMMLHPLYALKADGHTANYNEKWAADALKTFLASLPDGEETYFEGLRLMFGHIYGCALKSSNEIYFLDKTPRYYEVIPELYKVFPGAKFIILLRNPLAVLNSRITLLNNGKLDGLDIYKRDLFKGPGKMLKGIKCLEKNSKILRYEDLVENPEVEIEKLCQYLDIDYDADIINYNADQKEWAYGDPKNVYKNTRPNSSYKDNWITRLDSPRMWKIYYEYFNMLGAELFDEMGYKSEKIRAHLSEKEPNKLKFHMNKSLRSVMR